MKLRLRPGALLGVLAGLMLFLSSPAEAFQVKITAAGVQLKQRPDLRSQGSERLGPQRARLLDTEFAADGELWCRIELASRRSGWVQSRFVDPALRDNLPLRLSDLPASLLFSHAHHEVMFKTSLADPGVKGHLVRWTLVMELSMLKEHWDSTRQRLNFLDISRRIGVKISDAEYRSLQQELRAIELKFQQVLAQWQRS